MTSPALERLNRDCLCLSLDTAQLAEALDAELGSDSQGDSLAALLHERCPYVFAAQPVFVAPAALQRMAQVVRAVEEVVALPAWREQVLAAAPPIARVGSGGAQGVFFGYDFHQEQGRLGLIEINTNAGGAMLNAVLARAQRACCESVQPMVPTPASVATFEQRLVDMFRREWRLAGHERPLASIAIVDESPQAQFLYPEFLLFQRLFERHGIAAVIADPSDLQWRAGRLWHGEQAIDLVYNRLTDFYLEQPASAVLRQAWEAQGVVLTPHPQAHALYADKRRLVDLSDESRLQALGVPEATRQVLLQSVPRTELVTAAEGERLWAARRGLFFKPVAGYGSRAAYRGDKLTRRVWQEILAGGYVAQALVAPGERVIGAQGEPQSMKFDLRAYAYAGEVQWVAARIYQGQTTNFRQPGSGFAPVFSDVEPSGQPPRSEPQPERASYVFLLDEEDGVHALPHALYVSLARHGATAPALAGQALRLADWYLRLQDGAPAGLVNETYALARFDAQGRMELAPAPADALWPTRAQRERMEAMLFAPEPARAP